MLNMRNNEFIDAAMKAVDFASSVTKPGMNSTSKNKTGEIYRIWFINDPTCKSYVGQTIQGSYWRVRQHIIDAERNDGTGCPLLDEATRKYGTECMRYEILQRDIATREELDAAEQYWIKRYRSQVPYGYNVKSGGQGGGSVLGNTPLGSSEKHGTATILETIIAYMLSALKGKYGARIPHVFVSFANKILR